MRERRLVLRAERRSPTIPWPAPVIKRNRVSTAAIEPSPPAAPPVEPAAPGKRASPPRLDVVDWVRGAAVVLMIQTHLYDAWVSPAGKLTAAYGWTRFVGGIPSRLFLMLVGVSIALRFEAQLAKGVTERRALVRPVQRRGLEILGLAYLFRLQEYILGHMGQSIVDLPNYWRDLLRIDILNCIGATMLIVPVIAAPRKGRPSYLLALAGMLTFVCLGPVLGPAYYPDFIPTWISSYVGGQRPMSWFPLFPWAGWPLAGVIVGHLWVRGAARRGLALTFTVTGVAGLALIGVVDLIRKIDPQIIHYPSELVQQMGPGSFFYRLGMNGIVAFLGWLAVTIVGRRFSIVRQLGRTSLLVYWIHVDLCYGLIAHKLGLYGRLTMSQASIGLLLMIALMLGVSLAKTRWSK
jgi:uncharacterized membrane protein